MQSDKPKLDTETKIKLLLALINDEGRDRLEVSLEKLSNRLIENYKSHRSIIKKYMMRR